MVQIKYRLIMKRTGIMLALAVLLSAQTSQAGNDRYPEMAFEETTHNFRQFDREHAVQTCWFRFKNTGKSELVITSASGTCSCTKAEAPSYPVLPGDTDSIKVTFNGTDIRPGVIRKTVILTSNIKEKTAYLYITGEMVEKLEDDSAPKDADKDKMSK